MSDKKEGIFVPALIGGAAAGFLSSIPLFNCLCCLWIIGGAVFAAYLVSRKTPVPLSYGEGAILGIMTGLIAAIVEAFVSLPFAALENEFLRRFLERFQEYAESMPRGWTSLLEKEMSGLTLPWFMLGLLISAFLFALFGALGGIIGVSLFGKKAQPSPPQGESHAPQNAGDCQS